ncbi:unnamed protein product [Miscanthus lutarioriparius]|uniref:Uncharacterized protein n=1 Tax=Miscanthus lutarioriparius TaxID=422564 RepID=A0A811RPG7_9POAL|nr:unnamed protein product [Miscanthus lutarioriparius]
MTKPTAGFQTPRPSSLRSSSTAGARSSAAKLAVASAVPRDLASNTRVVRKCLDYDGDSTLPASAAPTPPLDDVLENDLAHLLDLPDPEVSGDSSSSSVIFAAPDDAVIASADSSVTEVAAPTDSTADSDAPLLEQIKSVMAELHAAAGLSPRSKRLLTALAEAASAELTPTTTTARRLRRATFWGKVRVAVLAATVTTVAAIDVALAAYLYARRVNDQYHVMPPT